MDNGYAQHFKKLKDSNPILKKSTVKKQTKAKMPIAKRKSPFPIFSLIAMFVILGGASWLYFNLDKVEEKLSAIEVKFLGTAAAEGVQPEQKKIPAETKLEAKKSPDTPKEEHKVEADKRNLTPEETALFNKLEERRAQLDLKEAELKKLDEELHNQKLMLEEKLKHLDELRKDIATQLDDRVKADDTKVDKLVDMYSNMKPQKAAKVIETINEDLAVVVLKKMKKKDAAEILNMMEQAKAQKLSEKFAGYRKD